jgi:adenosine 3'-phospho 5'-phosphosulfate transporter B2
MPGELKQSGPSSASEDESWSDQSTEGKVDSDNVTSLLSTRIPSVGAGNSEDISDEESLVLCVGVMRTGLKTLHRALRNLGYSNIYDQEDIVATYDLWDDVLRNKANKETFAEIFDGAEVVMGMPTFCFWEQIFELYPNARVILTVRDEDDWWESVQKAKHLMDDNLPGAPLRYGTVMRAVEKMLVPSYHKFCEVLRFAWATTLGAQALAGTEINENAARGSYRRHNAYVKSKLGSHGAKNSQLLVYNVREGWEPLCRFLGKEKPEVEFPEVLSVPYFPGSCESSSEKAQCETEERPTQVSDFGQEFEQLLVPDSDFGIRMREEMRKGLGISLLVLSVLMAGVIGVTVTQLVKLPVTIIVLVYLAFMVIGWNAYVVMHGLVMRVPALVVLPLAIKSLLIAACLHACFISYGILKEMLVTKDKMASPVLVLSARMTSVVLGAAFLWLAEGRVALGAPVKSMGAFVFTNEASTWAGYEMLKYLSFPVQVMAKSCKMLPNMIMGRLVNGTKYSPSQYAQAVAALVCVAIMHLSDEESHTKKKGKGKVGPAENSFYWNLFMGISLLVFFFVCDSFTSQWQTALYKKHKNLTQNQMMFGGNLLGGILTSSTLFMNWSAIHESMSRAIQDPAIMLRILALGMSGALGQFCIYSAIRILGPLSFTWIMTARQLLSVLISLVFFGHGINVTKVTCIMVVFAIMSSRQLARVMPSKLPCNCRNDSSGSSRRLHRRLSHKLTGLSKSVSGMFAPRPDTDDQGDKKEQ